MFKRIGQKELYKDKWLALYQDQIQFPDGSTGTYAWVNRKNGVVIAVVTTDNRILLNKEYRYVIEKYNWELPGGGIDEGETPERAAKRELYEETGIHADTLEEVGGFYPLHSFNTEHITVFYTKIEPTSLSTAQTESGEYVGEQRYVPFSEALGMIDSGEIIDAFTANVIQIVIRRLQA